MVFLGDRREKALAAAVLEPPQTPFYFLRIVMEADFLWIKRGFKYSHIPFPGIVSALICLSFLNSYYFRNFL